MSFLSIAFLAALPLALAPIVLHLFDRKRDVVIEWGAMQFLQEAAARKTSARRLKQWILLLLRVLMIAALVMALARPLLPGNWFGGTRHSELILIVDNSMSMQRDVGESTLFQKAMTHVVDEIGSLPEGAYVRIMLTSPYPTWVTSTSIRVDSQTAEHLKDLVHEFKTTNGQSDLLSALFTAVQTDPIPFQEHRQIQVITDGQSADWQLAAKPQWDRFQQVLQQAETKTDLEFVYLQDKATPGNVYVNTIRSNRLTVGVDQTVKMTAEIVNMTNEDRASSATWSVAEETLHQSLIESIPAQEVADVPWVHTFTEAGTYLVQCTVDAEDEFPADNQSTVIINVVDEIPILLVEGAVDYADLQRDSFFVEAALGYIDGESIAEHTAFSPTMIDLERFEYVNLNDFHAVVIPNLTSISEENIARLTEYVYSGGGLWIALGPRTDVDLFNQRLFADGNGLAPVALDRISEKVSEDAVAPRMNPFSGEHIASQGLVNPQLDLKDVTVEQYFQFRENGNSEVSQLLQLSNNQAVAVEKYYGQGRVIIQSVPLGLSWSSLARSQSFVVMVHDWLSYLSDPLTSKHNLTAADQIVFRVYQGEDPVGTLQTPLGEEFELTAEVVGDETFFRTSRTSVPGIYWLETGVAGARIPFYVRRPESESDLRALTPEDMAFLADISSITQQVTQRDGTQTGQQASMWPVLLILVIAALAAELLLSGMIARERFGELPIAETTQSEISFGGMVDVPPGDSSHAMDSQYEATLN